LHKGAGALISCKYGGACTVAVRQFCAGNLVCELNNSTNFRPIIMKLQMTDPGWKMNTPIIFQRANIGAFFVCALQDYLKNFFRLLDESYTLQM